MFAKFVKPLTLISRNSYLFCFNTAYLNPEKHIYMTHNPTNIYEDILQIGDYLMPQRLMEKQVSQVYVPHITSITFETLKQTFVIFLKNIKSSFITAKCES